MAKVLSSHKITQNYGGSNNHYGIDFDVTEDKKVYANSKGKVESVQTGKSNAPGSTGMASYGNMVLIKHPNGMKTRYAHLEEVLVEKGDEVEAGDQIGIQGDTGNSTGTHLHYEVYDKNGNRINPKNYYNNYVYS